MCAASLDEYADLVLGQALPLVVPEIPLQDNGYDCGLFALQYAEELLLRWPTVTFLNGGGADGGAAVGLEDFSSSMFSSAQIDVSWSRLHGVSAAGTLLL